MLDAIRAARAYVETFFDDGAARGIRNLRSQLEGLEKSATAAGQTLLAMSGPVDAFGAFAAYHFAESAAGLSRLSQQTQLSTSSLGSLAYFAEVSGGSLDQLTEAFARQTKVINEARTGSSSAAEKLQLLGLSVADVENLSSDEAFSLFSEKIAGISDPLEKAAAAMAIYEDAGLKLLPLLNSGASGLDKMRDRAKELGLIMSESDVAIGTELSVAMSEITQQSQSLVDTLGAALTPVLLDVLTYVQPLVTYAIEWADANRDLVVEFFELAGVVATAGVTLMGIGITFGVLSTIASAVGVAIAGIGATVAFLMSPLGMVTAALAGLVVYAVDFSGVWDEVTGHLSESLGLAADLIQNGEITAAFDLVWAQIQATWSKGVNWTLGAIAGLVMSTLTTLADGVDRIGKIIDALMVKLGSLAIDAIVFSGQIPRGMADFAKQGLAVASTSESAKNSLSGVSDSLRATASGFEIVGDSVTDAEVRLGKLKEKAIALNQDADRRREEEALAKSDESAKPKKKGFEPMLNMAPGGQAGTFSANASRQLYSAGGQSEVVTAVGEVKTAVNKVESAITKKQRVGA